MANFNSLVPFYDAIKQIVFQSSLDTASSFYIQELPDDTQILIIGGGTGKLLSDFNETQTILFLEKSSGMISKAQNRDVRAKVDFLCADIRESVFNKQFDCIITPFVLDCFSSSELKNVFDQLTSHLKVGGFWLQTDFYPQNKWQSVLVQFMYLFFRITAQLKVSSVANFDQLFSNRKFIEKKKVRFKRGLIQSKYYQKIA